jgi:hypothetical protein
MDPKGWRSRARPCRCTDHAAGGSLSSSGGRLGRRRSGYCNRRALPSGSASHAASNAGLASTTEVSICRSGSDSKCMQPFCERSDLLAQRRIGVPSPAPYKRLSLWETCRQLVEQAGDSAARRHRNHAENALRAELGDRRCRAPMQIMRRARMQHQSAGLRRRRPHRCRGSTIRWSGGRVLARPAPGGRARLRMTYSSRST